MSVGLLLITHPRVGDALRDTAQGILQPLPLAIATASPRADETPGATRNRIELLADGVEDGDGILILTDAFGATPANIAVAVGRGRGYPVIAGVNLPMLLRVLNYPQQPVEALAETALSAAHDGIIQITPPGIGEHEANHGVG
ncbi:PTS sugar transporter subunit IIA [Spiribacter vilamensis]|uniref:PTS system ascorbate-specific IIA component n=1 Tax=Spiribacter vilamensis TaxID=531306 RepID=A0A4Q8CY32_9GAMM|nr:PTS fructose transporter subunit IIA [Spiribacter vilamensis]RZU97876.1 PTS system ascorbate-specific IIA component [Spiribacter vilamensis]TVO61207.1 PTS fructose transporter subunit IIA [Spiribacter vilamensis]